MNENKTLIQSYINSLDGQLKPSETVAKYVSDEKLAKHIADCEAAFPHYRIIVQEMLAEGDLVVVRGEFQGVHRGTFLGIEATGKSVSGGIIIIYRVKNQKIVEHWMQFDMLGLLQQLQQVPTAAVA
jgi:predicted ester cyclase